MGEGWDELYRPCKHTPARFTFVLYGRTSAPTRGDPGAACKASWFGGRNQEIPRLPVEGFPW